MVKTLYLIPCHLAENGKSDAFAEMNLEVIRNTKFYFVENVRSARRFISSLKLGITIDELRFFELDKDTENQVIKEKILEIYVSKGLHFFLSSPQSRIKFVHAPLAILSFIIAFYNKKIGFVWLAMLVVIAEGLIVISRFVYSYEQTFMGDLVRFWYAALFLLGSAHTLVREGHVRVDILYAKAKVETQALLNIIGSIFFGIPLCALVMIYGMEGRSSTINSPIVNFEITNQGTAGLYVKYMMAGFLGIFAITMVIQFASYVLLNASKICKKNK